MLLQVREQWFDIWALRVFANAKEGSGVKCHDDTNMRYARYRIETRAVLEAHNS